ncbi:MAG: putative DNA binding domain-containing protein [Acholeplasmataceae bacterium]|nr:putative DNA binding domain-containing protein [Acholeplasmataceae bacterium]MBN2696503.1 putative DNA binding domain-containing protein [Bacilli bacterium]
MKLIESSINEFKLVLNDKFEKEVVSFINSKDGGNIYLGINDKGEPVGVQEIDKIQLEVKDRIKNNIKPSTLGLFDVVVEVINQIEILHIVIASGPEKPYYVKKRGMSPEGCFIRIGSSVESMNSEMIIDLFSKRTKNSLKSIVSPMQNLTFSQLKIFYEEAGYEIGSNFINQLDLVNDDKKYNYVAYLLSDNNTISIQVAKYQGLDSYNLIENEEYGHCCLIKAAKNVLNRLEQENRVFTQITSVQRKEIKKIDPIALREAVVNAIVHNDYSHEYAAKFELYEDRLEISSNGGLPERFTKEDFLGGFSAPKNKELMRVFKDVGLVEQLGTGIRRILKTYTSDIYEFYPNFIRVTFKFKDSIQNFNPFSTSTVINTIQKNIIEVITKEPTTTQEAIANKLNVSKRTIIRHMNILENLKLIKRVGDNRTGYWEILKEREMK